MSELVATCHSHPILAMARTFRPGTELCLCFSFSGARPSWPHGVADYFSSLPTSHHPVLPERYSRSSSRGGKSRVKPWPQHGPGEVTGLWAQIGRQSSMLAPRLHSTTPPQSPAVAARLRPPRRGRVVLAWYATGSQRNGSKRELCRKIRKLQWAPTGGSKPAGFSFHFGVLVDVVLLSSRLHSPHTPCAAVAAAARAYRRRQVQHCCSVP